MLINKYKLVIFDMDGTILDTLDDLYYTLNYALKKSDFPERSLSEVRSFVGNGIRKLIERGVPKDASLDEVNKVHTDFTEYYKEHCSDNTKAYDGIIELIKILKETGFKTAIVSNKADYAVQQLVESYFDGLFDISIGEREGIRKKPAPDAINEVLDKLKIAKNESVYVGDSEVDIQTARNLEMDIIAVSWGFRDKEFLSENGADIIVDSPEKILDYLNNK